MFLNVEPNGRSALLKGLLYVIFCLMMIRKSATVNPLRCEDVYLSKTKIDEHYQIYGIVSR